MEHGFSYLMIPVFSFCNGNFSFCNVKIKFYLKMFFCFFFPGISTSLIQEAIGSLLQTLLVFEVGPKMSIAILRVGVIVIPR